MNVVANRLPGWYWAVAILALLWMLFGVAAWCMDLMMDPAAVARLPEAQQQLHASRPSWLFVVYGVAIFSGLLGAIGLLLRKRWATSLFLLSLLAVIVQFGYTFAAMRAIQVLGAAQALPFPILIFAIGAALWWFSGYAGKRGWLA